MGSWDLKLKEKAGLRVTSTCTGAKLGYRNCGNRRHAREHRPHADGPLKDLGNGPCAGGHRCGCREPPPSSLLVTEGRGRGGHVQIMCRQSGPLPSGTILDGARGSPPAVLSKVPRIRQIRLAPDRQERLAIAWPGIRYRAVVKSLSVHLTALHVCPGPVARVREREPDTTHLPGTDGHPGSAGGSRSREQAQELLPTACSAPNRGSVAR